MGETRQGVTEVLRAMARKAVADARSELWRGPRVRGMFGLLPGPYAPPHRASASA